MGYEPRKHSTALEMMAVRQMQADFTYIAAESLLIVSSWFVSFLHLSSDLYVLTLFPQG